MPGAIDVTVEFTTMSNTFSMAGWRMGFAVGNERLLAALTRVKSYLDYGTFQPIQIAATVTMNEASEYPKEVCSIYQSRRDVLCEGLERIGWDIPKPKGTMFVWAPMPEPYRDMGSLEFAKMLIQECKVAVSPGIGFGEYGDDYVRIALVENEQRIRQAARNLRRFLDNADRTLHNVVPMAQAG